MKLKDLGSTELGECYIYTKSKGRLYGEPLTKVVPTHYAELSDFEIKIHWHTNDAAELRRLHRAVLKVLKERGSAEAFLQIKTILRARRSMRSKDQRENLAKAKSAQVFSESKSLESDEIELVTANLKGVT